MSTTTIPRSHARRIALLKEQLTKCKVFTLENFFFGRDVEPRYAWEALDRGLRAKLTDNGNGTFTVHVHANRWYELRKETA